MVKFSKIIFLFSLLSITLLSALSLRADDTDTRIFHPAFKTLKVSNADDFMLPPVIRLASDDHIVISFDEIADDRGYLQYRLIHCDADWKPSRIVESEYLDGFNIADVEDFAFSSNTFIHFVNYRIVIPDENIAPRLSGNYLVQVFDRDEPDETLLQARFSVTENNASISGEVSTRTDRGVNDEWQQLSLAVNLPDGLNINPYSDILVYVSQNGRPETRRGLNAPLRMEGGRLVYQHATELIFPAGNEYRRFETVRADYPGMHVDSARYMGSNYHAFLAVDRPRMDRGYEYDQTQYGRFLIREYNATDSDLGADYVTVHFTLDCPEIIGADIYVDGEMTHNLFTDTNRMAYDRDSGLYTLQLPLKQGSYNYQYVVKGNDGRSLPSPAPIEGNKYETRNEYTVEVYLRTPTSRFDRLLGYSNLYF